MPITKEELLKKSKENAERLGITFESCMVNLGFEINTLIKTYLEFETLLKTIFGLFSVLRGEIYENK